MKSIRRILVAILALALVVAGFAFMASAEEESPFSTPGINEIEDILEFYEYEVYVNNDFGAYDAQEIVPVEGTVDEVEQKLQIPGDASAGYSKAFDEPQPNMVFEFSVYLAKDTVKNLVFDLKALLSNDITDSHYTSLFQIDMLAETPAFKYSLWNEEDGSFEFDTVAIEGIAPAVETWYDVVLVFNADGGSYTFSITTEGADKFESPAISLGDKTAMAAFRLVGEYRNYSEDAVDKESATFRTKDVEIYGGTFVRDIDDIQNITKTTLPELAKVYDEAYKKGDMETCIRIAEVYKALDSSDSFTDTIDKVEEVYNYAYAQAIVVAVGAIDASDTYANRREALLEIDRYNSFIPANEALFDPEGKYITTEGIDETLAKNLKAARASLEEERATLSAIQVNSIAFVEMLLGARVEFPEEGEPITYPSYNYDWNDFDGEILPYYKELENLFKDESKKPDLTYSDENFNMETVLEAWEHLQSKISFVNDSVAAFDAYVKILNDEDVTFGTRYYDGYLPAKAYLEQLKQNEYFAIDTNADMVALNAIYDANEEKMLVEETNCQQFIRIVDEASLATYYTVLIERLDSAASYLNKVQDEYEGVPAAKLTYQTLRDATLKDKGNADAYIKKVNEAVAVLNSADKSFAQKKEALAAATALKSLGNIYGYEGVSEANVALSQMESTLLFVEGSSVTLISLVGSLADAATITERRAIIRLAQEALANSEATYEGVADAKAALEAAVTEFNQIVGTANTTLADATVNAAAVAAALSGDASIYKTASIIQDYAK